jgi:radical SAM superfamily enzyme with C-terminal helix-hairpin-helix motif
MGVEHVRLGGMTDTYTYMAEGVVDMEYPRPDPEPIAKLLHGLRDDERLGILHTDNGNPSIIAEHLEESEEITKTLVETLSDGAVLSFGLESADPNVHEANWLNCDSGQLKSAIALINKYGRERGERGLPKLLPGLNFIAGLNGETSATYNINLKLLRELKQEGHMIRRVNIRQVEGEGFQEIDDDDFRSFKNSVREEFDGPLLEEMLPTGTILDDVWWEAHDGRTRLPRHLEPEAKDPAIHGKAGITFGRQIGAYPILVGMNYLAPLENYSQIMVTGHGARSITGIETGLDWRTVTEKQLAAVPGISAKGAWNLIGTRAKAHSKKRPLDSVEDWFKSAGVNIPELIDFEKILKD